MFDVICYGDTNVDLITSIDKLPDYDEEVPISELDILCGGAATNVAVGLSRLGAKVAYMGSVGEDSSGKFILDTLEREKVDYSNVLVNPEASTGTSISIVDKSSERKLLTYAGANIFYGSESINKDFITNTKIFHMSSPNITMIKPIINLLKDTNITISIDPGSLVCRFGIDFFKDILDKIDILFINRVECIQLMKDDSIDSLYKLIDLGCKNVVYKKGIKGSLIINRKKEITECKSYKVSSIDTTGAGDAFVSGFIYQMLNDKNGDEILRFANAIGAMNVTAKGAQEGLPTYSKVTEFMEAHSFKEVDIWNKF